MIHFKREKEKRCPDHQDIMMEGIITANDDDTGEYRNPIWCDGINVQLFMGALWSTLMHKKMDGRRVKLILEIEEAEDNAH